MLTAERPTPVPEKATAPLESHAAFSHTPASRDPLTLLEEQAVTRLPDLVPIRYGRMLQSPFGYNRGAARFMAADLADAPRSGLVVSPAFENAIAEFGETYAELNDGDHLHLAEAAASGRVQARSDL